MIESKFLKQKTMKQHHQSINLNSNVKIKKKVIIFINKVLITAIISLALLISFKLSPEFKSLFNQHVYTESFPFAKVKELYQKYFGSTLVDTSSKDDQAVFSEKLTYDSQSVYHDGVALSVTSNYMIPNINSGIVVFIGEKENYGKTVIVQQLDGVDVWYGNVDTVNVKMYDYVEQGALLGEVVDNTLYVAFQKEGNFVNYKEYLT